MKKIFQFLSVGVIVATVISCNKDEFVPVPTVSPADSANLKIVHASAYAANPAVQFKLNGNRVTSNITYSYPFPGGGFNTGGSSDMDYLMVTPGATTFSLGIPFKGTNNDSIPLFSGSIGTLEKGKYYDALISDTSTNTKVLLVEENIAPIDTSLARFRFANLIPNLPNADIYFGTEKVASNVAYNTISAEFTIKRDSAAKWSLRPAGALPTSTATATYPTTATGVYVTPGAKALTVYSRGYVGTTGNRAPAVSLFYNKFYR